MTRSQSQPNHYQNELLSSQSSSSSPRSLITPVSPSLQPTIPNYPRDTNYPDRIQYRHGSGSSNSIFSFPSESPAATPTTTTSVHFPNGATGHSVSDKYNIIPTSGPCIDAHSWGQNSTRIAGTLTDFIDIDTPESAHTKIASDGTIYKLVFSDEFNKDGRTFRPGDDLY
ncbi:6359_t:CDS:2, partial [Dentiscutata heterogama]